MANNYAVKTAVHEPENDGFGIYILTYSNVAGKGDPEKSRITGMKRVGFSRIPREYVAEFDIDDVLDTLSNPV